MLYANVIFGQFIVIKPHVNTNVILSGHLEFLPFANNDKGVWSLDYNGSLFRLRYKDRYLEPSINGPKMIRGGKMMEELAKQETLAPLIEALKVDTIFDESSFYSKSNSDSSSVEYTNKNNKKNKKTNKKNKKSNDTSSSISSAFNKMKKTAKKANKNPLINGKNTGRNNLDPIVLNLIGDRSKLQAIDSKSYIKKHPTESELEGMKEQGSGFYFQLVPVFHNSISKKILIRFEEMCMTSELKFESCPFRKWWKHSARFYWHIYPTTNQTHIDRINNYLATVQQNINNVKKINDINLDALVFDETKFQESVSSDDSEDCCCDCNFQASPLMQGIPMGSTIPLTGNFEGNTYSCVNTNCNNKCKPINNCCIQSKSEKH